MKKRKVVVEYVHEIDGHRETCVYVNDVIVARLVGAISGPGGVEVKMGLLGFRRRGRWHEGYQYREAEFVRAR